MPMRILACCCMVVACQGAAPGLVLGFGGDQVAGAEVRIAGKPRTTAANGSFALDDAKPPYDAVVVVGGNVFTVYKGLTRRDPVLYARGAPAPSQHSATLGGTVSGGSGFPVSPQDAKVALQVALPLGFGFDPDAGDGSFSLTAAWRGPETVQATLHVLERSPGFDPPSTYTAYGERTLTVANGASVADLQVALQPVGTAHASGHLALAPDLTLSGLAFETTIDTAPIDGWSVPFAGTTFSVPIPDLPGAAVRVDADASGITGSTRAWRFLRAGMSEVLLEVPRAPVLLSPPPQTTDLARDSVLSWTEVAGAVYLLDVDGPDAASPHLRIVTSATSMPISQLDTFQRLPAQTKLLWRVTAIGPCADVDAAATLGGYFAVAQVWVQNAQHPVQDGFDAPSSGQGFTLAQ